MKKWYESKTIWVGLVTLGYGALKFLGVDVGDPSPESIATALGIITVILRLITKKPVTIKMK